MIIGEFTRTASGYAGRLRTLLIDAPVRIVAAPPGSSDAAPDWRVLSGEGDEAVEVGAGWNRSGARAGAYIALTIDDPTLGRTIRANLLQAGDAEGSCRLLWSRSPARDARP